MSASALNITYNHLIASVDKRLKYKLKNYPRFVIEGKMKDTTARESIECDKRIKWLLEKSRRDPQLNLQLEFEKKCQ